MKIVINSANFSKEDIDFIKSMFYNVKISLIGHNSIQIVAETSNKLALILVSTKYPIQHEKYILP